MMRAVHHLSIRTYLEYYKYRRSSNCGYFPGGGAATHCLVTASRSKGGRPAGRPRRNADECLSTQTPPCPSLPRFRVPPPPKPGGCPTTCHSAEQARSEQAKRKREREGGRHTHTLRKRGRSFSHTQEICLAIENGAAWPPPWQVHTCQGKAARHSPDRRTGEGAGAGWPLVDFGWV